MSHAISFPEAAAIHAPREERPSEMIAAPVLKARRVPALDGLRGLAILLVLLDHMVLWNRKNFSSDFVGFATSGWVGVELFFVLSGFLITGILFDTRNDGRYFRNFYARRALRIFPLYFVSVFVILAAFPVAAQLARMAHHLGSSGGTSRIMTWGRSAQQHQMWLWFYGSNIAQSFHKFDWSVCGHFWSLDVEEQFYLAWPLVIFFGGGRRKLMSICALVAVTAMTLRVDLVREAKGLIDVYYFTPCRLDSLAIGSFVALAVRGKDGVRPWVEPARWVTAACGAAILAHGYQSGGLSHYDRLVQAFGFTAVSAFFAGLLVLILASPSNGVVAGILQDSSLVFFGKYSYGIYIFHYALMTAATAILPPEQFAEVIGSHLAAALIYTAVALIATLGLAVLSWNLFEKRLLDLKKHFEYGDRAIAQSMQAIETVEAPASDPESIPLPFVEQPAETETETLPMRQAA